MVHEEEPAPAAPGMVMRISFDAGVGVTGGVALVEAAAETVPNIEDYQKDRTKPGPGGHEIFPASRSSATAKVLASCKRVRRDTAPDDPPIRNLSSST